jgi:hypothetical protein
VRVAVPRRSCVVLFALASTAILLARFGSSAAGSEDSSPKTRITAFGAVQGLPAPRAVTIAPRRLLRGEIGAAEPIALELGVDRPLADGGQPPAARRIDLSVVREQTVVDAPEPQVFFVSIQLDPIDPDLPPQTSISLAANRKWVEPIGSSQVNADLAASNSWRNVEFPESKAGVIEVDRDAPPTILVTEPLSVSAVIERHYPANLWSIPERDIIDRYWPRSGQQVSAE